jgi:signal transduction histidine kinase
MSRLSNLWSRFFLRASVLRVYVETVLVFVFLTLFTALVYQGTANEMTFTSLLFFINPFSALYYSLRLRIPSGRWYRQIGLDWFWITFPTLLFNPLLLLVMRLALADMFGYSGNPQTVDFLFIGFMTFPYVFFRVGVRFIAWRNDLRQRRMIWSLVTSNLIAVALLQAIFMLPPTIALYFSNFNSSAFISIPDNPLAWFLSRFQALLPMVGVAILFATTVLIALLPVSIAVSYFLARRIRRRLDALLDAAHAARDGDYDTRVIVTGRDEIARLQSDFNTMTDNLKINIAALREEREKVDSLLKTRRELMANVSHELRTPIATVRAYFDSALRQHEDKGDVTLSQNDLAVIQREMLRLQTLIDDLFALSRAEIDQLALKPTLLDGVTLIQRVMQTVAPLAWRINRVELVANLPTWLPNIVADESRLEQVLRNLIHNSLRHTPPGGLIIISAIEVDGHAEIQVKDTGEGILPENLPYIWERYYRDEENGGTGLGLALVKSFIEAMHGNVSVTSTPGEGACFSIKLPLADKTSETTPPLPKPQPVLRPSSPKTSVIQR